jgi:colanic acid/amylovoran biosynthesis glycosyltransferase
MSKDTIPRELIVLPSITAHRGPRGGLVLTQKYLNGVAAYADGWPGPVVSLVRLSDHPTTDMDHVEVLAGQERTAFEIRPKSRSELAQRLSRAAAVVALLSPDEAETAAVCANLNVPLIFGSEYSVKTEMQIIDESVANPLRRWRRKWWTLGAERKRLGLLRSAAGIQCSGTPTYEIYRHVNANALLYFDNRVPRDAVISEAELEKKLSEMTKRPSLRLVFGGRLIAMKGARYLPEVAEELRRLCIPFTMSIYGKGPLEAQLDREISRLGLEAHVSLMGSRDFLTEWVPLLKRDTDLFVCPHPQGDPSSTYPEVMSCGVPIVGFDNEAFVGVVEHSNGGWLVPSKNPAALAAEIARLHSSRAEIAAAALKAREFALAHAFEITFARRTRHLVSSSRLPQCLKDDARVGARYADAASCEENLNVSRKTAISLAVP